MLLLKPIPHETIWGGARIERYTGVQGKQLGHLYSLYCREGVSNEILNNNWKSRTLNDVFPLFKNEFGMGNCERFPLTIALTEADQNLSIQVHPDDAMAEQETPGTRGKRESWFFIETPETGKIINGCVCTDNEWALDWINKHHFMHMADSLNVQAGDYVFVKPGTLHAITAGSLVYEIEEGADHTYRFYDYDRLDAQGNKRELHIDKATAALNINLKSETKRYHGNDWIVEQTYATRLVSNQKHYTNQSGTLECFTLIKGQMSCEGRTVNPGITVILWPGDTIDTTNVQIAISARYINQ